MVKVKVRDSRSRNGTPVAGDVNEPVLTSNVNPPSGEVRVSYAELLDKFCKGKEPPASLQLQKIHDALLICREVARDNNERCDKGMRETSRKRKEVSDLVRDEEFESSRIEEERRKVKDRDDAEAHARPLAVGGRTVAPQDGTDAGGIAQPKQESPEITETQQTVSRPQSSSSVDSHQPRPAPPVPQVQTFGEDPSVFSDPTVYEIREIHDGLSEASRKEILGVSEYPPDDLHDLTPGTPPDRDFSAGKVGNQVTWQQYANYLDPYVRPLTQEDLAFLDERGERTAPYLMPNRGVRDYHAIWAEDDGQAAPVQGPQSSANQPSGSIEQMTDDAAEHGDVSTGPVLARLLGAMIPERRAPPAEANNGGEGEAEGAPFTSASGAMPEGNPDSKPLPPAAQMNEFKDPNWKNASQKLDYSQMDQKVLQELRHIGFIQEDAEPDYEGHHDDEVAARLRYLQEELQRVSVVNGARKARILGLAEEEMAKQEWSQITDDLDSQLNQAYLKRHRNIGKGKKMLKRPGGPGTGQSLTNNAGIGKPGVGEQIRGLMDRRQEWNSLLGPIVEFGHHDVAHDTIFDHETMKRLVAREQELFNEAQEE